MGLNIYILNLQQFYTVSVSACEHVYVCEWFQVTAVKKNKNKTKSNHHYKFLWGAFFFYTHFFIELTASCFLGKPFLFWETLKFKKTPIPTFPLYSLSMNMVIPVELQLLFQYIQTLLGLASCWPTGLLLWHDSLISLLKAPGSQPCKSDLCLWPVSSGSVRIKLVSRSMVKLIFTFNKSPVPSLWFQAAVWDWALWWTGCQCSFVSWHSLTFILV